jgi:hypothetical protein
MSGALSLMMSGNTAFVPQLVTHLAVASGTETIPAGASNVYIEAWGSGGGGRGGLGGGGGGGAYVASTYACSGGQTLSWAVNSVGAGGTQPSGNGLAGGPTTVTSGTLTITSISAAGGGGGVTAGGPGGTPATGGNVTNTAGNAGASNASAPSAPGGTAIVGVNYAGAGAGGVGGDTGVNGVAGHAGAVAFYYT